MPYSKGESGNISGRPKGTPNRATGDMRAWLYAFVSGNTAQIKKDWQTLEPSQRVMLFEKLLKYVVPAQTEITAQIDTLSEGQVDQLYDRIITHLNTQTDG